MSQAPANPLDTAVSAQTWRMLSDRAAGCFANHILEDLGESGPHTGLARGTVEFWAPALKALCPDTSYDLTPTALAVASRSTKVFAAASGAANEAGCTLAMQQVLTGENYTVDSVAAARHASCAHHCRSNIAT